MKTYKTTYFFLFTFLTIISFSLPNYLSANDNKNSLVALPYVYYSPETKIAFGVGSIYSFRNSTDPLKTRPSNMKIAATYTQRKQFIFAFLPEIYLKNESYYIQGSYNFYKYPDKFWGFGNKSSNDAEEDYTPNYFKTFTNIEKQITSGIYIGLRYQFEYITIKKTDDDGVLQDRTILGSEGGTASGLGFIINYDTRNHIYYPNSGEYCQIYTTLFNKNIGSDYEFTLVSIDLRKYYSVFDKHVLALQTFNTFINGNPPFQMMGLLGGSYWMRGYYFGRYRDKNMITFQSEYRFPVYWRFGGVGFLGFGDVADKIKRFQLKEFKYTFGAGIRFTFDKKEKINARLDFGFGKDGNFGFYAMVTEAF